MSCEVNNFNQMSTDTFDCRDLFVEIGRICENICEMSRISREEIDLFESDMRE